MTIRWLTAKETLELPEKIEEVNEIMLSRRIKTENNIFVFFYEDEDIFAQRLLKVMEVFDNKLDKKKIDFVKISDDGIDKDYSLECLPALVHFKEGEPTVFPGDLRSLMKPNKQNICILLSRKGKNNKCVVSGRRRASRNGFLEK